MKTTAQQSPAWIRILPASLQSRLAGRTNLHAILANTGWLFADRVLRLGAGLFVGVWVARYLGPEQFGLLNYAGAFVALFGAIASLGLNGIVVRDLVKHPENANETLGTAFLLQFMGGLLAFALALIAISYVRPDSDLAKWMVAVLGFVMVLKATDVVKYWFEAQVQSKYVVWIENGAFLVIAAIKVGLIVAHAPLMAFVWTTFAESALVAAGFVIVYARNCGELSVWRVRLDRAKELVSDSWPLILSGLTIMVYMRIDQIMIGQMLGDEALGVFSAAVRISEVWYFIPMAIAASVFPSILEAKAKDESQYRQRLQKLFDMMTVTALVVAIIVTLLAGRIIALLYGGAYAQSSNVLIIHIWAGVFVFLGVAGSRWFLAESLQRLTFYRTLAGATLNVALNLIWIPRYGVTGAAWATVVSQAMASVAFNLLSPVTRPLFYMQARSFILASFLIDPKKNPPELTGN